MKRIYIVTAIAFALYLLSFTVASETTYTKPPEPEPFEFVPHAPIPEPLPLPNLLPEPTQEATTTPPEAPENGPQRVLVARITGYNTVEAQTDATPCISASGDDICGRTDVVACPASIPFHTWVEINGKMYECLDRTHPKFGQRFDISFDKDVDRALAWGIRTLTVIVYNV